MANRPFSEDGNEPVDKSGKQEDEHTEEYLEKPAREFINRNSQSVFDTGSMNKVGGINTQPGVFDKKALF